jgi:hypothetical protein
VYITTNLITGKQYIGDHSTNKLNDGYLGSGIYLKRAVKEYGKENFKREELEFFDTKLDAINSQEKYIQQFNTLVPSGYNISAKGGYGIPGSFLSEESKKRIGEKNSKNLKGRKQTPEFIEKRACSNRGQFRSQETCDNISNALQGHGFSSLTIDKIKNTLKSKKIICEHCGKELPYRNYYQWHGDKCKFK